MLTIFHILGSTLNEPEQVDSLLSPGEKRFKCECQELTTTTTKKGSSETNYLWIIVLELFLVVAVFMVTLVILVSVNLGNALGTTKHQPPSEERFSFFDAELLQVFNEKEETNLLISPISVKVVLGMLMEGATGQSAKEIRSALRLPQEEGAGRKEFSTWLSSLQVKDSPNTLKIANRVFLSSKYNVSPDYGKTLKRYYSGGVTDVNFEDAEETTEIINNWVGNQTSQLIPSIVQKNQINPESQLILASAIYFRGLWSSPFATERTAVRCFYPKDNKCQDSLMMMNTGYFNHGYISRLDAQGIVLPYKEEKFSMLILLPSRRDGIQELARDLVHVSLKSILSELEREEVFVQIPQFEISYNDDLVDSLKKLQISQVFQQRADLSKIFTRKLDSTVVSHVFHSAKITVNEEGSEGAAATGALFVPLMGAPAMSFVANHPFLFFIIEPTKNVILFAGKVFSPQLPQTSSRLSLDSLKKQVFTAESNPVGNIPNSPGNNLKQPKTHRGLADPKYRSIKPTFSNPSGERRYASDRPAISLGYPFAQEYPRKTLPSSFYQKKTQENIFEPFVPHTEKTRRVKANQDLLKPRRKPDSPTEDWRHHALYFT